VIRVCLAGARGRMGRMLGELLAQSEDLSLISALEREGHPELGAPLGAGVLLGSDAGEAIARADVLLDFSAPASALEHLALTAEAGKSAVCGVTGFTAEQQQAVQRVARRIALLVSSNMSRGVYQLGQLVEQAARALPGFDAEILDIHHRNKADSPSGTALLLAAALEAARAESRPIYGRKAQRQGGEVGIAALRGGDVVGEHQVFFLGPGEEIILTHRATSREHFCRGALDAVRFVSGKAPGLYGMHHVFGGAPP